MPKISKEKIETAWKEFQDEMARLRKEQLTILKKISEKKAEKEAEKLKKEINK